MIAGTEVQTKVNSDPVSGSVRQFKLNQIPGIPPCQRVRGRLTGGAPRVI